MRCPIFAELPPPPLGKTGWPWTEESEQLHNMMPDGTPWPRVSIVTPSFNQAKYVEETIRSVLLQGYPDLEYIVIDGGSTDGSVDIIRKYEPWLSYWASERDRGQSHAINKGFERATGEIVAWLNSDDFYLPGAISQAAQVMHERQAYVVYGNCLKVDQDGKLLWERRPPPVSLESLTNYWLPDHTPPQPAVFWRHEALRRVGLLNESLHYTMDFDLWLRLAQLYDFVYVDAFWAKDTHHHESKSGGGWEPFERECYRLVRPYMTQFGLQHLIDYLRRPGLYHLESRVCGS